MQVSAHKTGSFLTALGVFVLAYLWHPILLVMVLVAALGQEGAYTFSETRMHYPSALFALLTVAAVLGLFLSILFWRRGRRWFAIALVLSSLLWGSLGAAAFLQI